MLNVVQKLVRRPTLFKGDNYVEKIIIGRELRTLNNAIRRRVDNSPIKHEIDDVTGTNGWIIGFLSDRRDQDVFQRDIEREFGITRSTASKVLMLMEKKGLVERVGVPHDARLKKIVLTPRSLELCDKMCRDREQTEAALTRGFTDAELAQLASYLERLRDNILSN